MQEFFESYPRLFPNSVPPAFPPVIAPTEGATIRKDFEALTGWVLEFEETKTSYERRQELALGASSAEGRFYIEDLSEDINPDRKALDRGLSENLANSLSGIFQRLYETRQDLRIAQAELATTVSLKTRPFDEKKLFGLFQQLLKSALEISGFQSAAICIMDEESKSLDFRIVSGNHFEGLLGTRRDLKQCRADVAALSGSIVTLTRKADIASWESPTTCQTAVCLPISSLDNLIGTLWLVSNRRKSLGNDVANVLEIVAGRIACELERCSLSQRLEMSLIESKTSFQTSSTERLFDQLPQTPFPAWNLSTGRQSKHSQMYQELFSIWRVTANDQLAILLGDINGVDAHQQANCLRSCFDVLSHTRLHAKDWLKGLSSFVNNQFDAVAVDSLTCIVVDPLTGEIEIANTGKFEFGVVGNSAPFRKLQFGDADNSTNTPTFLSRRESLIVGSGLSESSDFLLKITRA